MWKSALGHKGPNDIKKKLKKIKKRKLFYKKQIKINKK